MSRRKATDTDEREEAAARAFVAAIAAPPRPEDIVRFVFGSRGGLLAHLISISHDFDDPPPGSFEDEEVVSRAVNMRLDHAEDDDEGFYERMIEFFPYSPDYLRHVATRVREVVA